MHAATVIFWISLAVLVHTFVGYAVIIACLAWLRDTSPPAPPVDIPTVTVIVAAHNEANRIANRLQNLLSADYPADKLNIIIVSDGSTDDTVAQICSLADPRIEVLIQPHRLGKAAALNLALTHTTSDLVVFGDVRQRFAPDAIHRLVNHFSNLEIGAVSGELVIESATSAAGSGVDLYWKLEKIIRNAEARWDSSIGCTGAIYAIRRKLFQPLPTDTILDDVVIPMQISLQRYRIGFEPAARAYDPQTLDPALEQVRKRRTLAGNYQMLVRYPAWLLPIRSRLWWQLLSHKYLRLAAPFMLTTLFLSNILLASKNVYGLLFIGQFGFYALAFIGLRFRHLKSRTLGLPAGFVFLNWQAALALWHYLRNSKRAGWQMASK